MLKGLGHAILGIFSADQMVIELTKISKRLKTIEELKKTQESLEETRIAKTGED